MNMQLELIPDALTFDVWVDKLLINLTLDQRLDRRERLREFAIPFTSDLGLVPFIWVCQAMRDDRSIKTQKIGEHNYRSVSTDCGVSLIEVNAPNIHCGVDQVVLDMVLPASSPFDVDRMCWRSFICPTESIIEFGRSVVSALEPLYSYDESEPESESR